MFLPGQSVSSYTASELTNVRMVPEDPSGPPGFRGAWQKLLTPGDWLERGGSMSYLVPACNHQASGQGNPSTKSLTNLGPFLFECVAGGVVYSRHKDSTLMTIT